MLRRPIETTALIRHVDYFRLCRDSRKFRVAQTVTVRTGTFANSGGGTLLILCVVEQVRLAKKSFRGPNVRSERMKPLKVCAGLGLAILLLSAPSCSRPQQASGSGSGELSPQEARQIAKEAFIYGFPLVTKYETLHKQAVDTTGHDYRAPFNAIASLANVATPEDKFVVTPNSDTPYSFLWMDLRAEPIIVTMPKVEENRYYSGQLIDLYTFNFAYIGTRTYGNDGGDFLVAGPGWSGDTPKGITAVFHCETEFAYLLFRTQLFNPSDLGNVKKIQAGYKAQTLSKFLGSPTLTPAPAVDWPAPTPDMLRSPALFSYLNFMLQFCPTNPSEKDLMERFAKVNIGAGKTFDFAKLSPELQKAVTDGLTDVGQDVDALMKRVNAGEVSSADIFGTREFLKNNYLYRFLGAKLGLYGNSVTEAIYLPTTLTPIISPSTLQKPITRCSSPRASYHQRRLSGPSRCTTARPSSWWPTPSSVTYSIPPC